jgi:signal peptidase I
VAEGELTMTEGNTRRTPLLRLRYVILGLVALAVYLGCPFRLEVVRGDSMTPTLHDWSVCVLDRSYYATNPMVPGDVIAFRMGDDVLTKRVYGAPGEVIHLVRYPGEGKYIVPSPGMLSHTRRFATSTIAARFKCVPLLVRLVIPPGKCFVVGDNAAVSEDSRVFGLIDTSTVIGKMVAPAAE